MSYADQIELRFAVGEYTGRRDLSNVMPNMIQRAEQRLNRELRHHQMLTGSTITLVSGSGALPSDFIQAFQVRSGTCAYRQVTSNLVNQNVGSCYAVEGSNILMSGFDGDLSVTYYAELPTLTATPTTTNWLLNEGPDVYLYSVGVEVARFIRDKDLEADASAHRDLAISELKRDNFRHQYGDAKVRVQGVTP